MNVHPAARELLLLAIDNGWSAGLKHQTDSAQNPYVTVTAVRPEQPKRVEVTWHTRKTGTYRLFTCLVGAGVSAHDTTLQGARQALEEEAAA